MTPSFDQLLQEADLPPPGPDYFAARRRLWLTPREPPPVPSPSPARDKLEEALSHPDALHNPQLWNNGLERVWKGLSTGGRLKNKLPLKLVIKIIYAAWLRDSTWPAGMPPPPDSDQDQQTPSPLAYPPLSEPLPSIAASEIVEPVLPPWMRNSKGSR